MIKPACVSADRRYITWLAVVVLAYNYNVWFCTARLVFPYHSPTVNMYWIICDLLSDVVNGIDICIWQPRLQFVKGGDIIVSHKQDQNHINALRTLKGPVQPQKHYRI